MKHAGRMAKVPAETAEKPLAHQLQVHAETMIWRGIAPEVVEREVRTLESAIRAAVPLAGGKHLLVHEPNSQAGNEGFAHQECIVGAEGRANGSFHTLTTRS